MSLQVRPGYVNPLTIMKENKNNPTKRQMGNVQDDKADKLTDLRSKQQSLQNEIILLKSTGSDSAGNTSEMPFSVFNIVRIMTMNLIVLPIQMPF